MPPPNAEDDRPRGVRTRNRGTRCSVLGWRDDRDHQHDEHHHHTAQQDLQAQPAPSMLGHRRCQLGARVGFESERA